MSADNDLRDALIEAFIANDASAWSSDDRIRACAAKNADTALAVLANWTAEEPE